MVRLRRNPPLDDELRTALLDCWVAATNAGGAVGFVGPVTTADIRPTAEAELDRVTAGHDDLVVAFEADTPVGFGFLGTNPPGITAHWATVRRLQRHPDRGVAGVGAAVLDGLEESARERGLLKVVVAVRGGTGLERYYEAHGYRVEAVLPEWLRVGERLIHQILLAKRLEGPQRGGTAMGTAAGAYGAGSVLTVQRLDAELPLPSYAHPGDAGLDLHARADVVLKPGERATVATGIAIALPPGHVGLVHPRSGLAARHGIALVNSPGTIDEGYRGEVQVVLVNLDRNESVRLQRGDRIAQLLVQRVERVQVVEATVLPASARGAGGFGSTGR